MVNRIAGVKVDAIYRESANYRSLCYVHKGEICYTNEDEDADISSNSEDQSDVDKYD